MLTLNTASFTSVILAGEIFSSKDSLEAHKEKTCGEEETVEGTIFAFRKSMLDEIL